MFRNFVSNGRTYRVSMVANGIAYNLFTPGISDTTRDACLRNLAAKLGTDTRTAFRVARAMFLRGFLHEIFPIGLTGPVMVAKAVGMGYIND